MITGVKKTVCRSDLEDFVGYKKDSIPRLKEYMENYNNCFVLQSLPMMIDLHFKNGSDN